MAEPISIQIDPETLRTQIKVIIDDELRKFAWKLRIAADDLDPEEIKFREEWIEQQIEKRVSKRLKEAENER